MNLLDTIKETLEVLAADSDYPMSGGVYYGICNVQKLDEWNYFVFNRRSLSSDNDKRYTDYLEVHIVHEDYIMEGYEQKVIKALKEALPAFSLSGDATYDYVNKGDTQIIVEICNLTFKKPKKVDDGR